MQLVGLKVQNYLAFEEAEISLAPYGITLVVGANNAGKSALVSAVDRLARRTTDAETSFVRDGADLATVTGTFRLDVAERAEVLKAAGAPKNWIESPVLTDVRWTYTQFAGLNCPFELMAIEATDARGQFSPLFKNGQPQGNSGRVAALSDIFHSSRPPGAFEAVRELNWGQGGPESQLNQPTGGLMEMLQHWRSGVYHVGPVRPGTERTRPVNATPVLEPGGQNLAEVLQYWSSRPDATWPLVRRQIEEFVPGVGEIFAPTGGSRVEVVFRDERGRDRNLKDLGRGVEQLLMAAYIGVAQPRGGTVVLEEPEQNIHPGAQRQLFDRLVEWSRQHQFLIETHSSVFLDASRWPSTGVVLVTRSAGASSARDVSTKRSLALDELGVRLGDVLSASRIVIVEGPADRDALDVWFGERLRAANASVVIAGGIDPVWKAHELQARLTQSNGLDVPLVFICDRDEMSSVQVEKLHETGRVHVLSTRELENFLLASAILRPYLEGRLAGQQGQLSTLAGTDLEIAIREAADSLKSAVALRRLAAQLSDARALDRGAVLDVERTGITIGNIKSHLKLVSLAIRLRTVEKLWRSINADLEAEWEDEWREIAPGAKVLDILFRRFGLAYTKTRDCSGLARLTPPPDELSGALRIVGA